MTHRLGKNRKFLLSVLSVFVSASAAAVVVALAQLECMGLSVGRKDLPLGGFPRIAGA